MKLTVREVAILEVLVQNGNEQERGMYAGRVGILAGFTRSGRVDAGTTRTLDSLGNKGFVLGIYGRLVNGEPILDFTDTSRKWYVTDEGRKALAEFAFGE